MGRISFHLVGGGFVIKGAALGNFYFFPSSCTRFSMRSAFEFSRVVSQVCNYSFLGSFLMSQNQRGAVYIWEISGNLQWIHPQRLLCFKCHGFRHCRCFPAPMPCLSQSFGLCAQRDLTHEVQLRKLLGRPQIPVLDVSDLSLLTFELIFHFLLLLITQILLHGDQVIVTPYFCYIHVQHVDASLLLLKSFNAFK